MSKNEIDWSVYAAKLREAVDEARSGPVPPSVEEILFQVEMRTRKQKRSFWGYLADKWIDLVALVIAVAAFIRTF